MRSTSLAAGKFFDKASLSVITNGVPLSRAASLGIADTYGWPLLPAKLQPARASMGSRGGERKSLRCVTARRGQSPTVRRPWTH